MFSVKTKHALHTSMHINTQQAFTCKHLNNRDFIKMLHKTCY